MTPPLANVAAAPFKAALDLLRGFFPSRALMPHRGCSNVVLRSLPVYGWNGEGEGALMRPSLRDVARPARKVERELRFQ